MTNHKGINETSPKMDPTLEGKPVDIPPALGVFLAGRPDDPGATGGLFYSAASGAVGQSVSHRLHSFTARPIAEYLLPTT